MKLGTFEKEPDEEFAYKIDYDLLHDGETLETVALSARNTADDSDASGEVLDSLTATLVEGTASGGSTTTLIHNGANFSNRGVKPGDRVFNETKGFAAIVIRVFTTTSPYDSIEFARQAVVTESGDVYSFDFAIIPVVNGVSGINYEITAQATTSLSRVFEDSVCMKVLDATYDQHAQ